VSKNSNELTDKIIGTMRILADEDQWPLKFEMIEKLITTAVNEWSKDIDAQLVALVKDWEERMGDDDQTLYTLGVRRALDLIRGEERPLNS
jgi:hypothetical protein